MFLIFLSLLFFLLGGFGALLSRDNRIATAFGVAASVAGCLAGLIPAVSVTCGISPADSFRAPWSVPSGSFYICIDPLSAFFLIPVFILCALASVYGAGYMLSRLKKTSLRGAWFFFNLLTASMVLVITARNGVLFLIAWEVMALASFFLVTFEDEKEDVRDAGRIYLIATHLGTAFLLVFFILLGNSAGSLDFDKLSAATGTPAGLLFVLALIGFGVKVGFVPFHVWLPAAHPAAPSHVSAVMSGVMIKTGIYGVLRTLTFLGPPQQWWGWLMIGIGLTSGILGILFALVQHDLKRILAYSSVENIGVIALGCGVGLLGITSGTTVMTVLGFGGALFHVINHALFKGLLFLGAGAVLHETGTGEIEHLGGLLKRMPRTGAVFLIGCLAILGLPPLNGFMGEFLIYLGAFKGNVFSGFVTAVPSLAVIAGLALIGGLAAACFAKVFGIVFLGEPRSTCAERAHEVGPTMLIPMLALAGCCVISGLFAPCVIFALSPVVTQVAGLQPELVKETIDFASLTLTSVVGVMLGLLLLIAFLVMIRKMLLANRETTESLTWDCGYVAPSPRMQYTASSFVQPLTNLFNVFLQTRRFELPVRGFFPKEASFSTETPDMFHERIFRPFFEATLRVVSRAKQLQQGRVQLYILYIVATLLILLIWKLG